MGGFPERPELPAGRVASLPNWAASWVSEPAEARVMVHSAPPGRGGLGDPNVTGAADLFPTSADSGPHQLAHNVAEVPQGEFIGRCVRGVFHVKHVATTGSIHRWLFGSRLSSRFGGTDRCPSCGPEGSISEPSSLEPARPVSAPGPSFRPTCFAAKHSSSAFVEGSVATAGTEGGFT